MDNSSRTEFAPLPKKMRCVIVEDEIPASRLLFTLLKRLRPDWQYEVLPGTVTAAVRRFTEGVQPDLLFLDIHLADGNAFSFIEQARPQCAVIFTTAYDEYALRAFEVNSIDYLLKPFDEGRLEAAILKFEHLIKRFGVNPTVDLAVMLENLTFHSEKRRYRSRFLINGTGTFRVLSIEEVAYFYSENKVTFAITNEGHEHIIDLTLDKLIEQLDPDAFFRANRQYIVGLRSIRKVEMYTHGKAIVKVSPEPKEIITVSRDRLPRLREWING